MEKYDVMKKSIYGLVLLVVSMVLTVWAWASAGMVPFIAPGLALTTLSWTFMLATRSAFLERLFHGIENMYAVHKFTAVLSVILLIFHNIGMGSLWGSQLAGRLGNLGIYTFISIILLAFLGKKMKYESWRWIHRLVFLAYILGLLHVYLILGGQLLQLSLLSLVVAGFAILGLVSGCYIIFLYQIIGFKHRGKIVSLKRLNADTTELEIQLNQPLDYAYGQFAFLKILQPGFEKAPHPFSISGGEGKQVFFTIKASGDHTKAIYDQLKVGSAVAVDRAYGHMHLEEGQDKQLWIAGGIGLTPFISYVRQNPVLDPAKSISFYYAYTGQENAVYLDFLRAYAKANSNFDLHLLDSKVEGYLDFSRYPLTGDTTVFMCGPVKMMDVFAKTFHSIDPKAELVYEGFSFK